MYPIETMCGTQDPGINSKVNATHTIPSLFDDIKVHWWLCPVHNYVIYGRIFKYLDINEYHI